MMELSGLFTLDLPIHLTAFTATAVHSGIVHTFLKATLGFICRVYLFGFEDNKIDKMPILVAIFQDFGLFTKNRGAGHPSCPTGHLLLALLEHANASLPLQIAVDGQLWDLHSNALDPVYRLST